MASCALNYFNARSEGQELAWLPWRRALKLFNAQLAVYYPAYTKVIWQHWHDKAVNDVHSAIFDRKGKNDSYFCQLQFVSASTLLASNQTQRWNSAVKSNLFKLIIDRLIKRERQLCVLPTSARLIP